MKTLCMLPRRAAIAFIDLYQCTLSPDHGLFRVFFPDGCCIYGETCSDYAKRVLGECGILRGSLLALKRLLHCTPWQIPDEEKIAQMISKERE